MLLFDGVIQTKLYEQAYQIMHQNKDKRVDNSSEVICMSTLKMLVTTTDALEHF